MSPVPALTLFFLLFALSAHARPQRYLPLGRLPGDVNPFDRYLQRCGENREFHECGTVCPDTCEDYLKKPRLCTMQCVIGCQCKKGFVLRGETCVRPEECKGSSRWYLQDGLRGSKLYLQKLPPDPLDVNPIGFLKSYLQDRGARGSSKWYQKPPRPLVNPKGFIPKGTSKSYLEGDKKNGSYKWYETPLKGLPKVNVTNLLPRPPADAKPPHSLLPNRPKPKKGYLIYGRGYLSDSSKQWDGDHYDRFLSAAAQGSSKWWSKLPPKGMQDFLPKVNATPLVNPSGFLKSYLQKRDPGAVTYVHPIGEVPKGKPSKTFLQDVIDRTPPWQQSDSMLYLQGNRPDIVEHPWDKRGYLSSAAAQKDLSLIIPKAEAAAMFPWLPKDMKGYLNSAAAELAKGMPYVKVWPAYMPKRPRYLGYSSYGPPPYFPKWDPLYLGNYADYLRGSPPPVFNRPRRPWSRRGNARGYYLDSSAAEPPWPIPYPPRW